MPQASRSASEQPAPAPAQDAAAQAATSATDSATSSKAAQLDRTMIQITGEAKAQLDAIAEHIGRQQGSDLGIVIQVSRGDIVRSLIASAHARTIVGQASVDD